MGYTKLLFACRYASQDAEEGYFRLEWKLAIDRCHLMDATLAFLVPIVIDDISRPGGWN